MYHLQQKVVRVLAGFRQIRTRETPYATMFHARS